MSIRLRPSAKNKAVIVSTILTFITLGWKAVNALSNADWLLQSAGVKPEAAKFIASSRGSDLMVVGALAFLVLSLVFTYERVTEEKQQHEPPEHDLTPKVTPPLAAEKKLEIPEEKSNAVVSADTSDERIIVHVTPEYLKNLFYDYTDAQARKLVSPYIGKWLRVSGPVSNITENERRCGVFITKQEVVPYVIQMYFREQKWADRIAVLKRGDEVTVLGKINFVNALGVDLEDCELIDSKPADSTQKPLAIAPQSQEAHDLTFEIDEGQTQVRMSGSTGGQSIEADVRLRCHKTVERALAVREFRASLLREQSNGEETVIPAEVAKVAYKQPGMKLVDVNDPWTINEPISGYRYYKFRLDISHEVAGRLSRECFLRIAMYEGARRDPFTVDFYVNDWPSARQSLSAITIK